MIGDACQTLIDLDAILHYEGHHVFDIWYRNTSEVKPTAIAGDMHSINKANFAILHWFGLRFEPHFTDLNKQLQELYSTRDISAYKKYLIQPTGQIDLNLITREKTISIASSPRCGGFTACTEVTR